MRRILNLIINNSYRKPRVINITNLMKKQNNSRTQTSVRQIKNEKTIQFNDSSQQKGENLISWRQVNNAINRSQQIYSKEQLQINHLIKIQTKTSFLYQIYKSKYSSLTSKNVVNLLIKMLELRYINSKQLQQTERLDKITALAHKRLRKMTPQDMIRFLFSLKSVKINNSDLARLHNFINDILIEFTDRSVIKGANTLKTYQSFEVMSVQSTIKLIHSLQYLHQISGRQYEPYIIALIKQTLNYFHSFLKSNHIKHKQKFIKWNFYFSLIDLLIKYEMPPQIVIDFIKALISHKKAFIGVHEYLVNLQISITKIHNISQIRGDQIIKYKDLFSIYQVMYQAIQKPEEIIKIRPYLVIKHLQALEWFTEQQLSLLGFDKIKQITYIKVLNFTLKIMHKYLSKDYTTQLQKSTIEEWVIEDLQRYKEYLGQFLLFYFNLTQQANFIYSNDFNKILNLCLQFYSQLSFNTQAVILKISKLRNFKNTKYIIDIFLGQQRSSDSNGRKTKYFRKYQQIESYTQLFYFWKQIRSQSKFSFDQYREGVFIKSFFRSIIYLPNLQNYPYLIANKIGQQPQFLNLLVKKYKRYSIENRSLSKVYIDRVNDTQFRKQLQSIVQIVRNEKEDSFVLSNFASMKRSIRQKTKRSLQIYKFFIMLLENLKQRCIITESNITQYGIFQQITAEFQQEVQCLFYKQLFTLQIYELALEITKYLKSKTDKQFKVYNIQKNRQHLNINLKIQQDKGLLKFISLRQSNL